MVAVDDGAQVIQSVVPGSHEGLPDRALGQLAVAHEGVDPVIAPVHAPGQGHAHAHGQPVAQGAAVHLDAGKGVVGMADVLRAEAGELCLHLVDVQKALVRQHGIEGFHAVPLRQHKAVAVGVVRAGRGNVHAVVEGQHDFHAAHVPADVPSPAGHDNVQHVLAQVIGLYSKRIHPHTSSNTTSSPWR